MAHQHIELHADKVFTGTVPQDEDIIRIGDSIVGLKLTRQDSRPFTMDEAAKLLNIESTRWERSIANRHVEVLMTAMKRGTFRWELVKLALCLCREDGKLYRVNGQHTAFARYELGSEIRDPKVEMMNYTADTVADVRTLYASFDRGAPRTRGHVTRTMLAGTTLFADVADWITTLIAQGFSFWRWDESERKHHDSDDVAHLVMNEYADLVGKVVKYFGEGYLERDRAILKKAAVCGAVFATFSKNEGKAREFWDAVRTGANLSMTDPRLALRNKLMKSMLKWRPGTNAERVSSEDLYRIALNAWNAWRSGREVKGSLRVLMARPIVSK